jgi:DNA mismatch repair protein MSH6
VLLGQFQDDEVRSRLRTQLTAMQPVELVLPAGALSATTRKVLAVGLRDPRLSNLRGSGWGGPACVRALEQGAYWAGEWPQLLKGKWRALGCVCTWWWLQA